MRWRSNHVWALVFMLMAGMLVSCEEKDTQMVHELNEPDNLSQEVYDVYSRLLVDRLGGENFLVIQQETDTTLHRPACRDLLASDTTSLLETTMNDYVSRNKQSANMDYAFSTYQNIQLITREEFDSYENWEGFTKNYPDAGGILFLRLPGFNEEHTQALLEYTWRTGDYTKDTYLVYMVKEENNWDIRVHQLL